MCGFLTHRKSSIPGSAAGSLFCQPFSAVLNNSTFRRLQTAMEHSGSPFGWFHCHHGRSRSAFVGAVPSRETTTALNPIFFFSSLLVVPLWDSSALGLIVNWSKSDLQVNLLFATLLLNPLPRFSCAWLLAMTIEDEGTNQCDQATNVMDMHWLHV